MNKPVRCTLVYYRDIEDVSDMTLLVSGTSQLMKWASRCYNRHQYKQQLMQVRNSRSTHASGEVDKPMLCKFK
jgi:hypothetical protein